MKNLNIGFLILFQLLAFRLFSQTLTIQKSLENPLEAYHLETWGSAKGFHYLKVNDISVSPTGVLWIATGNGVVRYDGKNYTNFTRFNTNEIANNQITAILSDSKGIIWIAVYGGGLLYFQNNSFKKIKFADEFEFRDITAIVESPIDGSIWVGSSGDGVAQIIHQEKIVRYNTKLGLINNDVRSLQAVNDSTIYIGTAQGLSILKSGKFVNQTIKDGLLDNLVTAIGTDNNNTLWLGTRYGISVRKGNQWGTLTGSEGSDIREIIAESPQKIWISTFNRGQLLYQHGRLFQMNEPNNLTSMTFDKHHNLWLGSSTKGLYFVKQKQTDIEQGKMEILSFRNEKTNFSEYKPEYWKRENGLPHDRVNTVLQASDGYLWLGTGNGLARFNGDNFTTYSSFLSDEDKSNDIFELLEDYSGKLWIGTNGSGVYQFKKEMIESFELGNQQSFKIISSIIQATDSTIWIASPTDGIAMVKDDSIHYLNSENGLPNNNIRALFQSKNGHIYIGTTSGLYDYNPSVQQFYFTSGLSDNRIQSITESNNGDLWVGTLGGISKISNGKVVNFSQKDGLPENNIRRVLFENNRLWITTRESGISVYDGKTFNNFSQKDGLSSNLTTSIEVDNNHNIWIGTYNQGITRLTKRIFSNLTTKNGLVSNFITSLSHDAGGNLWLGTYGSGLQQLKNNQLITFSKKNGLTDNYITVLKHDKKGRLWIGTSNGLNMLEQNRLTQYNQNSGLPATDITTIAESGDGKIYIGTSSGGLAAINNQDVRVFTRDDGLVAKNIKSVLVTKNNVVWVGTNGNGLFILKNRKFTRIAGLSGEDGKPGQRNLTRIFNLYEGKDGAVYVSLNNGEFLQIKNETEIVRFIINDLKDRPILQMTEDNFGNFWAISDVGIFLINATQLSVEITKKRESVIPIFRVASIYFTTTDGLADNNVSELTTLVSAGLDHKLYFSSQNGISVLNTGLIDFNAPAPDVRLDKFISDDDQILLDRSSQQIELENQSQRIDIHFSVVDLLGKEKVQYRYRVLELGDHWQIVGNQSLASLGKLSPGNYQFQVMACNIGGLWNGKITVLNLTIHAKWWQTYWAFFGYLALAVFGFTRVLKFQRSRLQLKMEAHWLREKELSETLLFRSEMERKTKELDYARTVQLSMLPKSNIDEHLFEIVGKMKTASEVGGDYYDFLPMSDGRLCIAIGDATGHGVAAGLLVGMVKMALVNSLKTITENLFTKNLIENLNFALKETVSQRGMGMCILLSFFDVKNMTIEISSNGMPFPYHYKRITQELDIVRLQGLPIGFLKNILVQTTTVSVESGDLLIFVSDGIPERTNMFSEQWGYEKLFEEIKLICNKHYDAEKTANLIMAECDAYSRNRENDDDMTVVVLRIK